MALYSVFVGTGPEFWCCMSVQMNSTGSLICAYLFRFLPGKTWDCICKGYIVLALWDTWTWAKKSFWRMFKWATFIEKKMAVLIDSGPKSNNTFMPYCTVELSSLLVLLYKNGQLVFILKLQSYINANVQPTHFALLSLVHPSSKCWTPLSARSHLSAHHLVPDTKNYVYDVSVA